MLFIISVDIDSFYKSLFHTTSKFDLQICFYSWERWQVIWITLNMHNTDCPCYQLQVNMKHDTLTIFLIRKWKCLWSTKNKWSKIMSIFVTRNKKVPLHGNSQYTFILWCVFTEKEALIVHMYIYIYRKKWREQHFCHKAIKCIVILPAFIISLFYCI